MSKYVDIDTLKIPSEEMIAKWIVNSAPSIDIVRCGVCIYAEKASSPITALWCKRFGLKDMAVEADDFCSWGEREGE